MGTISSISSLLSAQTDGTAQNIAVNYTTRNSTGALSPTLKFLNSCWSWDKSRNGTGDVTLTTTPSIPTRTSFGAIAHSNASSGKELWLTRVSGMANGAGLLSIYDRLYHVGGFSGTVTTAQAPASSVSLTRGTSGVGNELFVEIHTAIGTTATTATVSYKNQAGTTKTSKSFIIGGTNYREVMRLIPVPLADGDTGVTEFLSITLAATTGAVGSFGVIVVKRILSLSALMNSFDASLVVGAVPVQKIEADAAIFPAICNLSAFSTGGGIDIVYNFVEV